VSPVGLSGGNEVMCGFPRPIQADGWISDETRPRPLSSTSFSHTSVSCENFLLTSKYLVLTALIVKSLVLSFPFLYPPLLSPPLPFLSFLPFSVSFIYCLTMLSVLTPFRAGNMMINECGMKQLVKWDLPSSSWIRRYLVFSARLKNILK
jgi:hypothetical protein